MDFIEQKKLANELVGVLEKYNLLPSHIQCSLNNYKLSNNCIVIFFDGIKFDKEDFKIEEN